MLTVYQLNMERFVSGEQVGDAHNCVAYIGISGDRNSCAGNNMALRSSNTAASELLI